MHYLITRVSVNTRSRELFARIIRVGVKRPKTVEAESSAGQVASNDCWKAAATAVLH